MADKHKCFISFKMFDEKYKIEIQEMDNISIIDKSLNDRIESDDPDYVMRVIRRDYLKDSTVTIHLIGDNSSENALFTDQYYIKKELQASLSNTQISNKSGILGVVLPNMTDKIFKGSYECSTCGLSHNSVSVDAHTVKEFSYNYYIPNEKCAWSEDDRYCVLVKWDDFINTPNEFIHQAYEKRFESIANKIKVRPK